MAHNVTARDGSASREQSVNQEEEPLPELVEGTSAAAGALTGAVIGGVSGGPAGAAAGAILGASLGGATMAGAEAVVAASNQNDSEPPPAAHTVTSR
ncbi:MAG: hypothetical protein JOZ65_28755 [Chloroflexi bacterium]|nr:hypothetical protein [Chloroflexota bacterium]